MHASDTRAKRATGTGALSTGRARICGVAVLVDNVGPGRLTITDGDGGATVLDLDFGQNGGDNIAIGGDGILVESDVFVSAATNITALTVFYH